MTLDIWQDALTAAAVVAVDPVGVGGVLVRARAGPVRAHFCDLVRAYLGPGAVVRRVPAHITPDRLLGGLDLAATLKAGRVVAERGLLASADGGIVLLPMAERLDPTVTAHIASALDLREVVVERDGIGRRTPSRFGLLALDEGIDDERAPRALADRLAMHLHLDAVPPRWVEDVEPLHDAEEVARARAKLPSVSVGSEVVEAVCGAALRLGIDSLRAPILALAVAKAAAALAGRDVVAAEDASLAARLVLASRATRMPEAEAPEDQEPAPPPPEPEEPQESERPDPPQDVEIPPGLLEDLVLSAAESAMPEGILALLAAGRSLGRGPSTSGPAGALKISTRRGRPGGTRRGSPDAGARLNLVETLRAAAPWQPIRRAARGSGSHRIEVRQDDFRITRYKERAETLTIFVVDASGSSALQRLAEAKGAVERVLADCYVRRDHVALIAFRGVQASLLLPPTRSLVRAKRSLAGLPGGGATPLSTGLDAARVLAEDAARRGQTPILVLMTDGRANVARDGTPGRPQAEADALESAGACRAVGIRALFVDTAPRPRPESKRLAEAMAAVYLPLPHTGAEALARVIRSSGESARGAGRGSSW